MLQPAELVGADGAGADGGFQCWDLPNALDVGTTQQQYNVPGRMAGIGADPRDPNRAGAFLVFASPRLDYDWHDIEQQKKLLTDAFSGMRWHVPHLLDSLRETPELYFDSISKVSVPRWSIGRVALLGDAGYGVTLGGMGVGTSIVGAYVLAGELAAAGGDHHTAFAAYEHRLVQRMLVSSSKSLATDLDLPDYEDKDYEAEVR